MLFQFPYGIKTITVDQEREIIWFILDGGPPTEETLDIQELTEYQLPEDIVTVLRSRQ